MTEKNKKPDIRDLGGQLPKEPYQIEMYPLSPTEKLSINSIFGPYEISRNQFVRLPKPIISSIGNLLHQYVDASQALIPRNRESDPRAYQYCRMPNGQSSDPFFQIDSVALSQNLIDELSQSSPDTATEVLRKTIFEFEPSMAMYQLSQLVAADGGMYTQFREHLDIIRHRHQKPIALLAPTHEKYQSMLATEFGLPTNHGLTNEQLNNFVQQVSGFDALLGPDQFQLMLEMNPHELDYLLYVRPSDPIKKLKNPNAQIEQPLLGDPEIRKLIRQHAINICIDNPNWGPQDPRKIKDSKAALTLVNMAMRVRSRSDLDRIEPMPDQLMRAKPRADVFGAYGQMTINLNNPKHQEKLLKAIGKRGPYVLQEEMAPLAVIDQHTMKPYLAMDRNFFSMVNGAPEFMGGIRILVPADSTEAKNGRLHGGNNITMQPILAQN